MEPTSSAAWLRGSGEVADAVSGDVAFDPVEEIVDAGKQPDNLDSRSQSLTDEEVARIRGRRAGVRASLACSGLFLTEEEERLLDEMEESKLTLEQRDARVMEFIGARNAQRRS